MGKSRKWSEQILVRESLETQDCENGKSAKGVLMVCNSGMEVFKKHFMEEKYKGMNGLVIPFEFVCVAGEPCPEGRFWELEYMLGETGMVHRGLIQAVNGVTDLPLVVGTLMKDNLLPGSMCRMVAHVREDIDEVHVGFAGIDEEGEAYFMGGCDSEKKGLDGMSIAGRVEKMPSYGVCMEFYRGDCREVWIWGKRVKELPKIFVAGSDNVNDACWDDKRKADFEAMWDAINEATCIAEDYGWPILVAAMKSADVEKKMMEVLCHMSSEDCRALAEQCASEAQAYEKEAESVE